MKRSSKSNGILQENQLKTTAFTTEASGDMNIPSGRSSNNGAVSICSDITEVVPKNEISPTSEKNYPQSESYSKPENTPKPKHYPKEVYKKTKKETLEAKREKKAAKTLAIITGAFVVCWLPFFVTVLVMSICPTCLLSDLTFSIFLWLGYFNSTLNPIIYTIFSPEFRQAFKRLLCGKKHLRYRPGKIN
ncbi:5-hydroxytryptamine receptor [Armadillidium vulgare]|nr:5-hydroxytryptamine receptor [Armadillidium vulgare]